MNISKSYLDRKTTIESKTPYLFISYSHKDAQIVTEILNKLYDKGVNYWYDKELHAGKKWNEEVLEKISDEKCLGVIFFCSKSFFESNPCHQEIIATHKKIAINANIRYIPVCVEPIGVAELIKNTSSIDEAVIKNLEVITQDKGMFHKDITYIPYTENVVEKLYLEIKKLIPDAINNQEMYINRLLNKKIIYEKNNNYYFEIGTYPQNELSNLKQIPTNEDVYDFEDNKYRGIKDTSEFFLYTPITFIILNIDEDDIIAIPESILDIVRLDKENIDNWIKDFKNKAFNEEELEKISDIRELENKDLERIDTLFRDKKFSSTKYSLSKDEIASNTYYVNDNITNKKSLFSLNGVEIKVPFNSHLINAGIIPLVVFKLDKIL